MLMQQDTVRESTVIYLLSVLGTCTHPIRVSRRHAYSTYCAIQSRGLRCATCAYTVGVHCACRTGTHLGVPHMHYTRPLQHMFDQARKAEGTQCGGHICIDMCTHSHRANCATVSSRRSHVVIRLPPGYICMTRIGLSIEGAMGISCDVHIPT